jgi:decaprenylphospho-beta-D-erythro-pentofuranosid-2-ulose 2-reductase
VTEPGARATGRRVLVLGGTSEIALAIVGELQRRSPRQVVLAGRDLVALEQAGGALRSQGCDVREPVLLDALDLAGHDAALERAFLSLGGVDIVILAVGVLGAREGEERDVEGDVNVLQTNAVGTGSLLLRAAERLKGKGNGTLLVLSSVAAERPRRANPAYGASKAALDFLAQGLGDQLHEEGVRVLVVRPGFVHTRMTRGLDPAPMASTPENVALATVKALEGSAHTVWVPGYLRFVMLVMRIVPRPIFRRIRQ